MHLAVPHCYSCKTESFHIPRQSVAQLKRNVRPDENPWKFKCHILHALLLRGRYEWKDMMFIDDTQVTKMRPMLSGPCSLAEPWRPCEMRLGCVACYVLLATKTTPILTHPSEDHLPYSPTHPLLRTSGRRCWGEPDQESETIRPRVLGIPEPGRTP